MIHNGGHDKYLLFTSMILKQQFPDASAPPAPGSGADFLLVSGHFGDMEHTGLQTVFSYSPGELNHARGTAGDQNISLCFFQVAYLAIEHFLGQIVVSQGI